MHDHDRLCTIYLMDPQTPFALRRREQILDLLRSNGQVTVLELAALFQVTDVTIRRDLGALSHQGLISRVHGGATVRSDLDRTVTSRGGPDAPPRFRIGMVVPTLAYYWPAIIAGARTASAAAQTQLVLRGASYDATEQHRQLEALVRSGTVDALIVAPDTEGAAGAGLLTWLDDLPLPVILAERAAPMNLGLTRLSSVATDHHFGAMLAVHHLYAQGHQRIGLVLPPMSPTGVALRSGWRNAIRELGLDPAGGQQYTLESMDGGSKANSLDEIVRGCRSSGTTALIVHSDPEAIDLTNHCLDSGIAIPGELALIAYDDEVAAGAQLPLTAMRPPKPHIGRLAVEMALARLTERARPIERVLAQPELIVRNSSGPPHAS